MTEQSMHTALENAQGDRLVISSHGARVLSWVVGGRERLFMPDRPDELSAPHGGVPVLFPQFGFFGPGRKHGVVRDVPWSVEDAGPQHVLLSLRLPEQEHVPACEVRVRVDMAEAGLEISFSVTNTSAQTLVFTCGLHTYLRIDDVEDTVLQGLDQAGYRDALEGLAARPASGTHLSAPASVDRVYDKAPKRLTLLTPSAEIEIRQAGFADTVVWNPGPVLARDLADLSGDEWRQFLCVEAAQISPPVSLSPWNTWYGSQTLRVLDA